MVITAIKARISGEMSPLDVLAGVEVVAGAGVDVVDVLFEVVVVLFLHQLLLVLLIGLVHRTSSYTM